MLIYPFLNMQTYTGRPSVIETCNIYKRIIQRFTIGFCKIHIQIFMHVVQDAEFKWEMHLVVNVERTSTYLTHIFSRTARNFPVRIYSKRIFCFYCSITQVTVSTCLTLMEFSALSVAFKKVFYFPNLSRRHGGCTSSSMNCVSEPERDRWRDINQSSHARLELLHDFH